MRKRILFSLAALFFAVVVGGCATERRWAYKAEPPARIPPLVNKTVAVGPLQDMRENENINRIAVGFIPLMPFGHMDYHTPEGASGHLTSGAWFFRPREDFAKAIAEELNNAGIFKEAFFTYRSGEGDLEFRGDIKSTFYHAKVFTYGLSIYGGTPWYVGFPMGTARNELVLSLQLVDGRTNEILWQNEYARNKKFVTWMYAMKSDFLYDILLKDIMKDVTSSLRNRFAGYSN